MPGCYIGRQAVHLPIVDIKPCFENLPQASIRFQPVQNDGRIVVGVLDGPFPVSRLRCAAAASDFISIGK
jgi:hypothetical protein